MKLKNLLVSALTNQEKCHEKVVFLNYFISLREKRIFLALFWTGKYVCVRICGLWNFYFSANNIQLNFVCAGREFTMVFVESKSSI